MSVEIPLMGGVNLLADPRRIRDDEVAFAKNLVPIRPGILSSRPALQEVGILGTDPATQILDGAYPLPFPSAAFMVQLYQTTSPYMAMYLFTQSGAVVNGAYPGNGNFPLISAERQAVMFSFGAKAYFVPGPYPVRLGNAFQRPPFITAEIWAGPASTSATDSIANGTRVAFGSFAGTGNDTISPRIGASYRQRVVWANFGEPYSRYVIMSDNYKPDTIGASALAANGRAFELAGAAPGDEIVALQEVMLTAIGSPAQSALLVLMRYGAYLVTGQLNQSDGSGTNDMVVSKISFDTGCVSPWSVATSPYGTFWVGPDDVWFFAYGQVPLRVGTKIRPAIQRTPAAAWRRVRATYFDGFLRVQLAGDGQGSDDNTPFTDEWWLDLRNGPPQDFQSAQWWGPQQFFATSGSLGSGFGATPITAVPVWVHDRRAGQLAALYGLSSAYNGSGPVGAVVSLGGMGSRDDLSYQNSAGSDGNVWQENSTEILVDLRCKEYDEGAPSYQKLFQSLFLALWVSLPTRLLVDILSGDGAPLTTCVRDVSYSSSDFVAGASQLGTGPGSTIGRLVRQIQSVGVYSDPTVRVIGNTMQPRIYTQTGVLIVAGVNDTIVFAAWPPGSNGPTPRQYIVTIPAGLYTNFGAIGTALASAPVISSAGPAGPLGDFEIGLNRDDGGLYGTIGAWYIAQNASGGLPLIVNMMPNSVRVANAFASNQQLQACRTLLSLMGFGVAGLGSTETDLVGVYDGGSDQTIIHAPYATYPLVASAIEISGAQLQTELIKRTP